MNRLRWGGAGHEREYTLNVEGYNHEKYIPQHLAEKLAAKLPQYDTMNRGSRIEILIPEESWNEEGTGPSDETHEEITTAVEALFGATELIVIPYRKPEPPRRTCGKDGCTTTLPLRELLAHRKGAH